MNLKLRTLVLVALLALLAAACGADDGATVRDLDPSAESGSGASSGSSSATGSGSSSGSVPVSESSSSGDSGSATGISTEGVQTETDNELVAEAVESYETYVSEQVDELIEVTTTFTDAVRAADLEAAQEAYAPSREPWERIEPIAGLIEDIDVAVDARVDDFEGPEDPMFTGWHRLEYLLFEEETTEGAAEFADQLDADLDSLQEGLGSLEIPPATVAVGGAELIEEVSLGKITGEEDRYSKTDLWDFNANAVGAMEVIELLTPALEEADPELLASINDGFDDLNSSLEPLQDGDGWVLYCRPDDEFPSDRCPDEPTVEAGTIDQLQAQLAGLSEDMSQVAGALGLQ